MTNRRSYSYRSVQQLFRPGMSHLDLALALEDAGFSVGGFVTLDENGCHAFLQKYAGVTNREGRIRSDAPNLPSGALILCQHAFIGERHVVDCLTGMIAAYREPPEKVIADPHAKPRASELPPRDERWGAP
ncbi:MAG: hypothetical protein GC155_09775 [Alphaproteobacteria bacterium]|nr:hypothetical protein [Alphaproteobacteria bacterium]